MSSMIKCDSCKRIDYADSSSETVFWIVNTNGRDGYSTFHLCEKCYYKKLLRDLLGIDITEIWEEAQA